MHKENAKACKKFEVCKGLAPSAVEILVKRKANFFLQKKSDQRKLLFLLRKIAFIEQDYFTKNLFSAVFSELRL
jgi:hypothetical protein